MARPWPRVLWKWAVSSTSPPSAVARGREVARDLRRVRHPRRVAEADLLRAGVDQPPRDGEDALLADVALVRAAEGDGDDALAAQPLGAGAAEHALEPGERLLDRAVDVPAVVRLGGREEDVDLVEAVAVRSACSSPFSFGTRTESATPSGGSIARRTSPASASCGITSARTKLVTSSRAARCGRARRSAAPCRRSR